MKNRLNITVLGAALLLSSIQGGFAADYGAMWANHKDAFFNGAPADHTYVCFNALGCYANPGENYGGTYLGGTYGYGDRYKGRCSALSTSCRISWGVNGMCHQGANRMLFTSGKTVSSAKGYWVTSALYGTYGTRSSWLACRAACGL